MSITIKGVTLEKSSMKKGAFIAMGIVAIEALFSFLLYFSLVGRIFAPKPTDAAAGVPQLLSYQGRLTDTSGNPLGGTGTVYCFRYGIYDAPSGGSRVWPAGAASSTNSTTTVTDGIFNDTIGRMDSLTYDFVSTSTLYLNVDVNTTTSTCGGTWESLSPRQQIVASGFALNSQSVYGSAIRVATSTKVQIGTGAGVSSGQTMLSLDNKSASETIGTSCTDNGSMWYNSALTKALVCEGGTIQQLSNPTSTIAGIKEQSTSTAITGGTVNFSAQANITIGQTGSTLGFSVAAPSAATLSRYMWPTVNGMSAVTAPAQGTASIQYVPIYQNLSATRFDVAMSVSLGTSATANTAGVAISQWVGIFSKNGATLMSLTTSSNQQTISWASNSGSYSSITGVRLFSSPININATPGEYYVMYNMSTAQTSLGTATTALAPILSIFGQTFASAGFIASNWGLSATSSNVVGGMGVYSAQINSNFGNVSLSAINQTGANASKANIWVRFSNT